MTLPGHTGAEPARSTRMSWEEYERLEPDIRHEYVDGCLVVNPRPRFLHQQMLRRLTNMLEAAVPAGYTAVNEWAWKPAADEWDPDVMVCAYDPGADPDPVRFTGTPVVVVVLSSNRAGDLVKKLYRYAEAGLARYWVADPDEPSVRAFELRNGMYEEVTAAVGDAHVEFDLGVARVTLAPSELIR
ncbi:MAG: Uma2 family endonuclease [Acidimicrobiia bacterium]